jgi:CRISPR-associated protein Cas2
MLHSYGSEIMMILITYDVNTESAAGKKRLRRVARICINCGQRVQNSVFECVMDTAKLSQVRNDLVKAINTNEDSLRIYHLGNNYKEKVEHFGIKPSYDPEGVMMV